MSTVQVQSQIDDMKRQEQGTRKIQPLCQACMVNYFPARLLSHMTVLVGYSVIFVYNCSAITIYQKKNDHVFAK